MSLWLGLVSGRKTFELAKPSLEWQSGSVNGWLVLALQAVGVMNVLSLCLCPRVSIPRSTLLPAYQYKAHRRCSFDPSDSLGLPSVSWTQPWLRLRRAMPGCSDWIQDIVPTTFLRYLSHVRLTCSGLHCDNTTVIRFSLTTLPNLTLWFFSYVS